MANRLAAESSPYLRQHAGNPVDWYPWGEEAFAVARELDRPVLLSVGYSSCHWCHVMAHESFDDPEIAALMNELFINIKVDREERPDIDAIYMRAVLAITGNGGWPMTVFLTPQAAPFHGGTYFPPEDRLGMRGFPAVLRAAAAAYRERRSDVEAASTRLRAALDPPRPRGLEEPDNAQLERAVRTLMAQADLRQGGFGGGPKFPHAGAIDLLLRRFRVSRDPAVWQAAEVALDRMARGGVHDQVGGGFHRYSVDAGWAVPHFEKMLYDNALLAPVYLHAHLLSGEAPWRRVVERTLDWALREMQLPAGGFASAQDADSEGGEGAHFVWTPAELAAVLGPEATLAARVLGITPGGNFEGATSVPSLPLPLEAVPGLDGDLPSRERWLNQICSRLLAARSRRPAPARDDKVVTSWNALMLRALAEAGMALGRTDYLAAARACADFLLAELVVQGKLMRTWCDGAARIPAFLEDLAYLADALLTLYEATGEPGYFAHALELSEQIRSRFHVPGQGLYDTASDAEQLLVRPHTIDDNPIPAGQSVAALAFLRLAAFTADQSWRERALEVISPLAAAVARAPLAVPNLAAALEMWLTPVVEVAISGEPGAADTAALLRVVSRIYDPNRVVAWGRADGVPLLEHRPPLGGVATAYVCEGFVCRTPIIDPQELEAQLTAPVPAAAGPDR